MVRPSLRPSVTHSLRVGSRGSALARRQTEIVMRLFRRIDPRRPVEFVSVTTQGDRDLRPGVSPDFTGALEQALLEGEIDVAVHSTKDLAAFDRPGLVIAAYPRRADPRDCWVAGNRRSLPEGARVGTSSLRRRAQLLRWRPDLRLKEVRGNVDTRISLVRARTVDAVVLAKAGIDRLGRAEEVSGILPLGRFLPAPGQGAIALQVRRRDRSTRALAARVDHSATRSCVEAERSLARGLGASCDVPLGALARVGRGKFWLEAEVLSEDGVRSVRSALPGSLASPRALGRRVALRLERAGARALLANRR